MSSSTMLTSVRRLRCLLAVQQVHEQTDEQLLHDFTHRRDDDAFGVLVRRHGPMVLGVCRRILGHEQDAEDAFQATFLVLARRAASLRNPSALASFLHGTAYHLASKVKRAAGRRRKHEEKATIRPSIPPQEELLWREVRALLDEEIARLPEKYRSVFVLCCLEELSQAEAGRRLGLKEGTVANRLAQARKRLAHRLVQRGVELTAVLAVSALATQPASALPTGLTATTLKAALAIRTGEKLAGLVSASVLTLMESSSRMLSKAKLATLLLAVSLMASGVALAPKEEQPQELVTQGPEANRLATPERETEKSIKIRGRVLDPDGQPKAGAKIHLLAGHGKIATRGVTAVDGRFSINVPNERKTDFWLVAQADGFGIDFFTLDLDRLTTPVELRLVKDQVIRGRVVNTEGNPVAGVCVDVKNVEHYADGSLDSFLAAWKKWKPTSERPGSAKNIPTEAPVLLKARTDAEGRFALHGVGRERVALLHFSEGGIADIERWVVSRDSFDLRPYNQAMLDNFPKWIERSFANSLLLQGADMAAVVAEAEKPILGLIKDADSGKVRPAAIVRLSRINDGEMLSPALEAKTDAQGRYHIRGARKAKRYLLEVAADTDAGYMPRQIWVGDTPGYQPLTADLTVKKGVVITGRILDGGTGKPIPGFVEPAILGNNAFAKDYPLIDQSPTWLLRQETSADGRFRVVAIPGPVLLMAGATENTFQFDGPLPDTKHPEYFTQTPDFLAFQGANGLPVRVQGTYCKVLDIQPGAPVVEQNIVLKLASALPVQIQDAGGKPLADVWVAGVVSRWHPAVPCKEARCTVYQLERGKSRPVIVYHPGRKLIACLTLRGDDKPPVVAKLGPAGSIKGRLLDAEGQPLAGVVVDLHYQQSAALEIHKIIHKQNVKQATSDSTGAFTLEEMIPDQKCELVFRSGKREYQPTGKAADTTIEIKPGESHNLGAIRLKRVSETIGE